MGGRLFDTPPLQSIDRKMSRGAIKFEILHAHFFFSPFLIRIFFQRHDVSMILKASKIYGDVCQVN